MPRLTAFGWILLLAAAGGCSVTGTWRTVHVEAGGGGDALDFSIDTITFADDGRYTATTTGPNRMTTTGTYRFRATSLTLIPADDAAVTYGASVRSDRLLLTREVEDARLEVTLSRTSP